MNTGSAIIIAATVLALSIVGSAYLITRSVDGVNQQLAVLERAAGKVQIAAGDSAPAERERRRRQGPDPEKVYKVNIAGSPFRGPADAKVTLVEFSDFQCPYCSRVTPTLNAIREQYEDDVKIVFKHLPLTRIHPKAPLAHAASEAAHAQGKFWEMHDLIFANQRDLEEETFIGYAEELGLDVERFKQDMKSPLIRKRVDADAAEAARLSINGTPGFMVNGRFFAGAKNLDYFKQRIDEALGKS